MNELMLNGSVTWTVARAQMNWHYIVCHENMASILRSLTKATFGPLYQIT